MSRILRQGLGYCWSVTLPEYRRRGFFHLLLWKTVVINAKT